MNIKKLALLGTKGVVLGRTLLFRRGKPYGETLAAIRKLEF